MSDSAANAQEWADGMGIGAGAGADDEPSKWVAFRWRNFMLKVFLGRLRVFIYMAPPDARRVWKVRRG